MIEQVALMQLRVMLYGAAQRLRGNALKEFFDLIDEIHDLKEFQLENEGLNSGG